MIRRAGFTLVEIMIVISIIGILAAIIIPNINDAGPQSRDAERQATLSTVQAALELYKNEYGRYPEGCNDGPANVRASWEGNWSGEPGTNWACPGDSAQYIVNDLSGTAEVENFAPQFIPNLPRDPWRDGRTDRSYVYTTNPDGSVYKFMSLNGVETETVTYSHPLARCGNLFVGGGEFGNECTNIPINAIGGYGGGSYNQGLGASPLVCRQNNAGFDNTYAVWGGYAERGWWNQYENSEEARELFSDWIRCK